MGGAIITIALAVAVGGVVIGALVATTTADDQAKVTVEAGRLTVKPLGMMALWSLSGGVDVPISAMVSAAAVDRSSVPRGFRAPGAYLPGVVCAGTYRQRGSKGLWMVGRAKQVLDIELQGEKYKRVVVQVADPAATADAVHAGA